MLDNLIHIDQQWLLAINACHTDWLDEVMWIISRAATWIPLYLVLAGLIFYRYRHLSWWRIALLFVGFGVAVGGADYISSGIIKHMVCRLRPTHEPALESMIHLVHNYRGGMYGFVSSHAANTMACATLFSLLWCRPIDMQKPPLWGGIVGLLYLWVIANCYSRMYLGVHYLGDILGGLVVGVLCSALVYYPLHRWVLGRAADEARGTSAGA